MFDAIKRKEKQAHSFVIDIQDWKGTEESALNQAYYIFEDKQTDFVENLAIINGNKIILVLKR